jgi:ribonuclease VapC
LFGADGPACRTALASDSEILLSAATLAEALIVASSRGVAETVSRLVADVRPTVVPVNAAMAERVATAHNLWGKRRHSAALNFGDCFSYTLAKDYDCPLLYIGNDFAQTDVRSVL